MVDASLLNYSVTIIDEKGEKYNIKDYITDLGWEENEKELASRISFTVVDRQTSIGQLSAVLKPGCVCIVYASAGGRKLEVARGNIVTWAHKSGSNDTSVKITCYDVLYNLQKSQDNYLIKKGTGVKKAITKILDEWKVPLGNYEGPDFALAKKLYKSKNLSDILLDILNDAAEQAGEKCVMRDEKGQMAVTVKGSNETVYYLDSTNCRAVTEEISTADMVTRVKVYGKEGSTKAQATLDGKTEFGIRQKIYIKQSKETKKAAKQAGQKILDEKGNTDTSTELTAVDVPTVRKWDKVYLNLPGLNGYFYVCSVHHDSESRMMDLTVKLAKKEKKEFSKGDYVYFNGGVYYASPSKTAKKFKLALPGRCKITKILKPNKKYARRYYLKHIDKETNVNGYVEDGSFDYRNGEDTGYGS